MRKMLWLASVVVLLLVGVVMVVGQSPQAKTMGQPKQAHYMMLTSSAIPQQPDWQVTLTGVLMLTTDHRIKCTFRPATMDETISMILYSLASAMQQKQRRWW